MPTILGRGQITSPDDLDIYVVDSNSVPVDPYAITYALYDATTGVEVLIGPQERLPVRIELGHYYAHFQVPENVAFGIYRVRWALQETTTSPVNTVLQEFEVRPASQIAIATYSPIQLEMIGRLRKLLRDNNPSRNYNFRPPTSSGTVNQFNRVFAYIWEDDELLEYMEQAVYTINSFPPATHYRSLDMMVQAKPDWRPWVMWGAIVHAAMALTLNWIAEEFNYSIGGISLDLEKSSKYEGIKSNAESQFDKMMEAKARTVKIMRGLQQSRYGLGVRSAFGPHTGRGVLTPRKFMGI